MIHQIPLEQIDPTALTRDRLTLDDAELDELKRSILAGGLRQPIEVYEVDGTPPYGLISGFRRLTAIRQLQDWDPKRFASIPAFIRAPHSVAEATRAMVEENEIRANLSAYERARTAVLARDRGIFDTLDAAINTLYAAASPAKRSKLRGVALVAEHLEGALKFPEALSIAQASRIANALRQDFGEVIEAALTSTARGSAEDEWAAILPYVEECENRLRSPETRRPGRPRRTARIRPGLSVRREMTRYGWILRFSGREATSGLLDDVMDEIERLFARQT